METAILTNLFQQISKLGMSMKATFMQENRETSQKLTNRNRSYEPLDRKCEFAIREIVPSDGRRLKARSYSRGPEFHG